MTNPSIASDLIADHDAALSRVGDFIAFADGLLAAHQINDLRLVHELASKASQLTREVDELREAGRRALNYLENTEGEFGINLESADMLREALSRSSGRMSDATE